MKTVTQVPASCTECGANFAIDPYQTSMYCPYCGTMLIVQKAIVKYNYENIEKNVYQRNYIQVGEKGIIQSVFDAGSNANEYLQERKIQKIKNLSEDKRKKWARKDNVKLIILLILFVVNLLVLFILINR